MRTRTSRLLCWLMSVLLCAQLVPTQALAYPAPQVVEGTYSFTTATAIDNSIHVADTFTFREDCFMRSSFLGCTHLSELSAQLAMSSFGWFGEAGDPYEDNIGDTGHNMKNLLSAMGFSNVQTNGYCQSDTLTDSVGVAVGRRTISVGDNTYTLLAVPIRSSGYKREWVGNFTVGNESLLWESGPPA
ncbi:MAG: hypothetical protein Q4A07_12220 [Coriobacteriales bacterium]|nr:hypothetical protein [Coriobacteriales bacterium]